MCTATHCLVLAAVACLPILGVICCHILELSVLRFTDLVF